MAKQAANPKKTYYTISEVSEKLGLATHMLRFWETKFAELRPRKVRGRRYYQQKDIDILAQINKLVYIDKLSIEDTKRLLRTLPDHKADKIVQLEFPGQPHSKTPSIDEMTKAIDTLLEKLQKSKEKLNII